MTLPQTSETISKLAGEAPLAPWEETLQKQIAAMNRVSLPAVSQARRDALKSILKLALIGAGTGVGLRTLYGVFRKKSSWILKDPYLFTKQGADTIFDRLLDVARGAGHATRRGARELWERGMEVRGPADLPWYMPLGMVSTVGGLYGGYKLSDWILDKMRSKALDRDIEQAKREFQSALAEEYRTAQQKRASALGEALDLVSGVYAEHGIEKTSAGEIRKTLGAYLALATLIGLGGYLSSRGYFQKTDPARKRVEAILASRKLRYGRTKRPLYTSSELFPGVTGDGKSDGEEEHGTF